MECQVCKVCGENKSLLEFTKGKNIRNGIVKFYFYKTCKVCDKPRINQKDIRYKFNNRELLADKQKFYYQEHKKESSEYHKKLYLRDKEIIKQNVKKNLYLKRKSDPVFKLKENISANIRQAIKKNGESTFKNLPYSIKDLKEHLEKQFEPWMNWNNHGIYRLDKWNDNDQSTWTWQLDHIIPHSKFLYENIKDENFKKCWALDNLRPYSAKQNIIDGNRNE